jgi:CRISPR/Cas system-associated exonuclease Cas4 (RecB family)
MADDRDRIIDDFNEAVNMALKELEDWLQTDESKSVGQSDGGSESKGHESGRMIVEIKRKNKSDYTDDDIAQMKRVVSYVHRHRGQGPNNDVENSRWRYSLMNWGNDPLK